MDRSTKAQFIDDVRDSFEGSPFVILTEFKGSTVLELDTLRRACEEAGARFQVVKNTLCRIALQDTEKADLAEHFRGNVGVVFSGDDPAAAAKAFRKMVKENDKLQPKVGFFEGTVLDPKQVDAVADLPSREQLLAKLLGIMIAAPRKSLALFQAPARQMLYVLQARVRQLEGDEG